MNHALVRGLRDRGIDLTTVFEEGLVALDDRVQLDHAIAQGRTIYTYNTKHFQQLHNEYAVGGKRHAGIIVVSHQRHSVGGQIRRLLALIQDRSAEEIENVLHYL